MQLRNATVLVVDDELDLRDIMAEWFRREGCRVLLAENGMEALKLIHANQVDVVVSDIRMPVMDGITLLKNVRSAGQYKPSVLFISGFTDVAPREAYDLGVEAMISKPLERKHLITAVTRILTERNELWRSPPEEKAGAILDITFESLATALSQGLIVFGRGGFCAHSTLALMEGPVALLFDFAADKRRVTGRGIVRWISAAEAEVGIEFTYIDDNNRAWIISLTEPNKSLSYIPRTTAIVTTTTMGATV